MSAVYQNIQKDKNEYAADGWQLMPLEATGGNIVVFKDVKLPFDDYLVQGLIEQYESDDWQRDAYSIPKIRDYMSKIGFEFKDVYVDDAGEKKKRLDMTDIAKDRLCSWRIEMDFSDGYLRISPFDITFPYAFYGKKILDEAAPEIIESAKSKGLIAEASLDA